MDYGVKGVRMGLDTDDEYPSGIRWFGASWHAPICEPMRHMPTPVGWPCLSCEHLIGAEHRGVTMGLMFDGGWSETYQHLGCFLAGMGLTELDLASA